MTLGSTLKQFHTERQQFERLSYDTLTRDERWMRTHGHRPLADLDAAFFKEWAIRQRKEGKKGPTVYREMHHLLATLKAAYALSLNDEILPVVEQLEHAVRAARIMKVAHTASARKRIASPTEINTLIAAGAARNGKIRFERLIPFALATSMRLGEICRITWGDWKQDMDVMLVRDRKDPRQKYGNDDYVPLTPTATAVLHSINRGDAPDDARIFPYDQKSVSHCFRELRKQCGIEDLRFHDLRRTGAQRLMDHGLNPEQVAAFTGHKTLDTLRKHYARPNPLQLVEKVATL